MPPDRDYLFHRALDRSPTRGLVPRILLVLLLVLAGCAGGDEQKAAGESGQQVAAADSGQSRGGQRPGQQTGTSRRPDQPPTPVAVAPAQVGDIASYYHTTATLEAERQAEVLARIQGVVDSLACEEGDLVRGGDLLLRIGNDEYRLRVQQAAATTANLAAKYKRLQAMVAEDLASQEEFQAAQSELDIARSEEGLARLNLSYTEVTAPLTGKVVQRLVDVGQNVSPGTALFVLADFRPLLARVHVPSKEFRNLQPDQPVQLVLDSDQTVLAGRIKLISPVIDPTSGTIKVTVEVPDYPAGTRPGDFAEVRIVTERRTGVILVPRIAVLNQKGEDVLYVAAGGRAERRVVETGFSDDEHTQVLSGVEPGERVIVRGQRSLKHGAPIKILPPPTPPGAEPDQKPAPGAGDS